MDNEWEGVRFSTLAEKAKLKPSVKYVYITGHDGYSTNLKLQECLDDDVLIVHHWNGIPLPREHGRGRAQVGETVASQHGQASRRDTRG